MITVDKLKEMNKEELISQFWKIYANYDGTYNNEREQADAFFQRCVFHVSFYSESNSVAGAMNFEDLRSIIRDLNNRNFVCVGDTIYNKSCVASIKINIIQEIYSDDNS